MLCADQRAFVITLTRAGEDDKSFKLTDIDSTFASFAGADYDLQVGSVLLVWVPDSKQEAAGGSLEPPPNKHTPTLPVQSREWCADCSTCCSRHVSVLLDMQASPAAAGSATQGYSSSWAYAQQASHSAGTRQVAYSTSLLLPPTSRPACACWSLLFGPLQDALNDAEDVVKNEGERNGIKFYDYEIKSPVSDMHLRFWLAVCILWQFRGTVALHCSE